MIVVLAYREGFLSWISLYFIEGKCLTDERPCERSSQENQIYNATVLMISFDDGGMFRQFVANDMAKYYMLNKRTKVQSAIFIWDEYSIMPSVIFRLSFSWFINTLRWVFLN